MRIYELLTTRRPVVLRGRRERSRAREAMRGKGEEQSNGVASEFVAPYHTSLSREIPSDLPRSAPTAAASSGLLRKACDVVHIILTINQVRMRAYEWCSTNVRTRARALERLALSAFIHALSHDFSQLISTATPVAACFAISIRVILVVHHKLSACYEVSTCIIWT